MKKFIVLCMALLFAGCTTVTLAPKGESKISVTPDHETRQHFFIGGLFGNAVVEAGELCKNQGVRQLQTQEKVEDRLLTIITLGIYAPRTSKVWCN
tara:strand:- start:487 stop:774 length:288 start_codon:yes stop_codon:yes gene_type:complete